MSFPMFSPRPAWATRLPLYIGPALVMTENAMNVEGQGEAFLRERTRLYREKGLGSGATKIPDFLEDPDLTLVTREGRFDCVLSARRDGPIAIRGVGFPYVDPEFRGRGIISEIWIKEDEEGSRPPAHAYTMAGFMSRVKTHRLHVQKAIAVGKDVPAEVMADYEITDGRVRLRAPYTPQRHNPHLEAINLAQATQDASDKIAGLVAVFQQKDEEGFPESLHSYDLNADGARLAIALRLKHGGVFQSTKVNLDWSHQVRIGGLVIDAYGIRKAEDSLPDLVRRLGPVTTQPETRVFENLIAFSDFAKAEKKARDAERSGFFYPPSNAVPVEDILSRADAALKTLALSPVEDDLPNPEP